MACPLSVLFSALEGSPSGETREVTVTGLHVDSRRVEPGHLFVDAAEPGGAGGAHVADAVRRGAVALVLPPGTDGPPGVPAVVVADPRAAFSRLADVFYGHPSADLRVLGVTGSNGKTTVASMLAQSLRECGVAAAHWTTDEVWSGARRFRPVFTTPEAGDLHRFLREALEAGRTHASIEVSSHAVVARRVADVRFAGGAVTGITPDHIDFHGTFEAYLEAKAQFLRMLPEGAACLYNGDDGGARRAVVGLRATTLSYGESAAADLRADGARTGAGGASCTVHFAARARDALAAMAARARTGAPSPIPPPPVLTLGVPVPGLHNLLNALAALGLAVAMGVPAEDAATALGRFQPPARRLAMRHVGGHLLIDDVAMNEASFDAVLAAVAAMGLPRLVVVVALRGHRGTDVQRRIADTLSRWNRRLRFAPLVASLSRTAVTAYSADHQVRPEELDAFLEAAAAGGLTCDLYQELEEAVGAAVGRLGPEGALLLLGTFGMDAGLALALRLLGGEALPPHPAPRLG